MFYREVNGGARRWSHLLRFYSCLLPSSIHPSLARLQSPVPKLAQWPSFEDLSTELPFTEYSLGAKCTAEHCTCVMQYSNDQRSHIPWWLPFYTWEQWSWERQSHRTSKHIVLLTCHWAIFLLFFFFSIFFLFSHWVNGRYPIDCSVMDALL